MPRLLLDLSPLRNKNYARILLARTISIVGLGMLGVAIPVQVQSLTGSTLWVGLVSTVEGVATFIGMIVGGKVVDSMDRRRVILLSRLLGALCFAALAANSWLASPYLAVILFVGAIDGFFGAFATSALLAITPVLVAQRQLAAAGALNMATIRLGTVASPAIGGIIIAQAGVGVCYVVATVLSLVCVSILWGLPPLRPAPDEPKHNSEEDLPSAQGFRYILRHRLVLAVILVASLSSMMGGIRVVFPAIAAQSFGGGPELTGFFFTAVPVGALIATALSGWLGHLQRPLRTLFILLQASFLSIIGFGAMALYSLPVAAAMGFLVLYGVLSSWSDVIQFTILQTETPDQVRGRVNGVWLAQEVSAESVGAMGTGAVGRALGGAASSMVLGTVAFLGLLGVVATSPHPSTSTKEPA